MIWVCCYGLTAQRGTWDRWYNERLEVGNAEEEEKRTCLYAPFIRKHEEPQVLPGLGYTLTIH